MPREVLWSTRFPESRQVNALRCLSVEAALRSELQLAWNRACSDQVVGVDALRQAVGARGRSADLSWAVNHSDLATLRREVV